MVAFINGELPLKSRRRVARYIDECESCYTEYIRQKQIVRDLQTKLPIIGDPSNTQLGAIWSAIQSDLQTQRRTPKRVYRARYGFMTLGVMLVLIMPFTLGNGFPKTISLVGTQPAPYQDTMIETTVAPDDYRPVAMATMTADYQNHLQETEFIEQDNVVSKEIEPQLTPGNVLIPGD